MVTTATIATSVDGDATLNRSLCDTTLVFARSTPIRVANVEHIVGCFCGILALLFFAVRRDKMPSLLVGAAQQKLMWWTIGTIIMHNFSYLCIEVWREYSYFTYRSPCDLVLVTWQCMLSKVPSTAAIATNSGIYLLTIVDVMHRRRCYVGESVFGGGRASSKADNDDDKRERSLLNGTRIFAFLLVFVTSLVSFAYYNERPFDTHMSYCVATSPRTVSHFVAFYAFLFVIDSLSFLSFCYALRQSLADLKRNQHGFIVAQKVRMRDNIAAIRFHIAATALRFIFFVPVLFSLFVLRLIFRRNDGSLGTVETSATDGLQLAIIPWYGCALAGLLFGWRFFLVAHSRRLVLEASEERGVHFNQLRLQWECTEKEEVTSMK